MRLVDIDSKFSAESDDSEYEIDFEYGYASVYKNGRVICEFYLGDVPVSCDLKSVVKKLEVMAHDEIQRISLNSHSSNLGEEIRSKKERWDEIIKIVKDGGVNEIDL